jgi:hypothetical protein
MKKSKSLMKRPEINRSQKNLIDLIAISGIYSVFIIVLFLSLVLVTFRINEIEAAPFIAKKNISEYLAH